MDPADFRFHGPLKDFLAPGNRDGRIRYPVERRASVKDVIEALGPPHTEVGAILVEGEETGFGRLVEKGMKVEVFPLPIPIPVTKPTFLRPNPLPAVRFVVDVNVGKLANLLRILGVDAAFNNTFRDAEIAEIAAEQKRIVLTMDRDLLKRSQVVYGRLIRPSVPEAQLQQVLEDFGLCGPYAVFSRCLRCNIPLVPVDKADILHRLEPKTKQFFEAFQICPQCDRIYWPGSHHEKMIERLKRHGIVK